MNTTLTDTFEVRRRQRLALYAALREREDGDTAACMIDVVTWLEANHPDVLDQFAADRGVRSEAVPA